MSRPKKTPREAYLDKLDRDLTRASDRPSRFLTLKWCAAQHPEPMAVDRVKCCGQDVSSYFFYRLDDAAAEAGGYKLASSIEQTQPGVFVHHYHEVERAEGLDEAFSFVTSLGQPVDGVQS